MVDISSGRFFFLGGGGGGGGMWGKSIKKKWPFFRVYTAEFGK